MRIEALALAVPSREVSNAEVVELIGQHTTDFDGNLDHTLNLLSKMLIKTGLETRRWLEPGEFSLDYVLEACRKASTGLGKNDKIDLLVYCSVYGELIEPSTSNLLANHLGLHDCQCFDIKAACDGWMKAAQLANFYLSSGEYHRIMVVTGEFSMTPGYALYPGLFKLRSPGDLEHRFPAFTIGESATATIFVRDDENPWRFTNKTRNDLVELCTVTPSWYVKLPEGSGRIGTNGPGLFTSWAKELSGAGIPLAIETFQDSGIKPQDVDILFTHCSSSRDWRGIAEALGLGDKLYDIYRHFGNVVSGGVPTAMERALRDGGLQRGYACAVLIASAGMSFSTVSFAF